MRIMGLDFGSKTVGVAVSDSMLVTAQGLEIIRREKEDKLRRTLARIEELIEEYEVEEIVLGLPKNMNATEGERVELTRAFKEKLERRTGLPVILWDERLTTVAADKAMIEAGIRREKRKDYVDKIAAALILQGYLDNRSLRRQKQEEAGRQGAKKEVRGADRQKTAREATLTDRQETEKKSSRSGAEKETGRADLQETKSMSKPEKITFNPGGEEAVDFYVLEQTRISGINYILVTEEEEGDGEALILRDDSMDGEEESVYTIVSDDDELSAVAVVFENMLDDVELENE